MNTRLIIGVILLIICCLLTFLIPKFWSESNNCKEGICPFPTRRGVNDMLDWLGNLEWYFIAGIVGAIAFLLWYFVGD